MGSITKVYGHTYIHFSETSRPITAYLYVEAPWVSENENRYGAGYMIGLAGIRQNLCIVLVDGSKIT